MQMSDNHGMQMPDLYAVLPPSPCKMAVWGNTGTAFIFSNTSGQASSYNPMTRLAGRTPLPGDRVFCEQVPAPAGMSDRSSGDRVLLRNDGGTPDGDVPALVAKARQWESLCKPDPQLTSAMVVVADILYRIEPRVLHRLNACAEKRGLGRFEFVSSAINRMHNRFTNPAEAVEIMAALKEALEPLMSRPLVDTAGAPLVGVDGKELLGPTSLEEVLQGWLQAVDWMRIRERCMHPLNATQLDAPALHKLQREAFTPAFEGVCGVCVVLLNGGLTLPAA